MFCQQCGGETAEQERDGRVRPVCPRCGAVTYLDPKLAAAVLIGREGRILLGRRAEGARAAGLWSFPAGFVERGERVETAAAREAWEEVGLRVDIGALIGLFSYEGETVALAVYEATAAGEPSAGDDIDHVDWFAPDDLPPLAFPHDAAIIAAWNVRRTERSGSPSSV